MPAGCKNGGDVRISGIKVGSITNETLDPKTFQAMVQMSIDPSIKLPVDSVAQSRRRASSATISSRSSRATMTISFPPGGRSRIPKRR